LADISTYLQRILSAIYGEEVRGSIHDAIAAMNVESSNAIQFASTAKDSAQASAASAQESASTAAQNASEASSSAAAAKTSEANAANNAAASAASAASAKASETAAASSETVAVQKAGEAANSETAAAQSAEEAAAAKVHSEDSAASAAASALSAQQYSGNPPKPQDGTWWIWDAERQEYTDSKIGCELAGPPGTGVQDIVLTSGDHTPGTSDIYTIILTDGTSKVISVYNGRNGTGAGDVLGISFDLLLPAAGWADGVIILSDSRLIASARYKYFLAADETCRDEYINCGVEPRDVTTDGEITFSSEETPTVDLTVSVMRLELGVNEG